MTTKADVSKANQKVDQTRAALTQFWGKTLDDAGNFEWTFGDPSATIFAIRIWVGYDKKGRTKVNITYPVANKTLVGPKNGISNSELQTIENLAYELSGLLDKDIGRFAHGIYDYLQGLSDHESFVDTLWVNWVQAKEAAAQVASAYKETLEKSKSTTITSKEVKKKARFEKRTKEIALMAERERVAKMIYETERKREMLLREARRLKAEKEKVENGDQEKADETRRQLILEDGSRLFEGYTMCYDAFSEYLKCVFALESTHLLWQKSDLDTLPPVISRIYWLQEVNLSENQLTVLPPQLLNMPKLKRLYLHGNLLCTLPPLAGVPELEVLDIHNNYLTSLPDDIGILTQLQMIDVEKNKIRAFPNALGELKRLQHLNVAQNLIKLVPTSLVELPNLTFLKLKNNPIVNLPPDIYLKGTAASMKYLKEQLTNAGEFETSTVVSDFSLLLNKNVPNSSNTNGGTILADLILRSDTGDNIQVHRIILSSRSSVLSDMLGHVYNGSKKLSVDTTTGLPILELKLNQYLLQTLVTYLYTDGFTRPTLQLINVEPHMSEPQRELIIKQNQQSTQNHEKVLDCVVGMADEFNIPHLKYLVDCARKPVDKVESRFLEDIKCVYKRFVDIDGSVESSSSLTQDDHRHHHQQQQESSSLPSSSHSGWLSPCDVSFSFPSHPEFPLIHAHKIILCARSAFMESLLTSQFCESRQEVVEMREIDPNIFKSIVEFCYTDDVYELNGETIMELLSASRMYGLNRLVGIVESVVGYSLDIENVAGILIVAFMNSLEKLARACKFFTLSNWESVTHSEGWKDVPQELAQQLTKTAIEWGIITE